MLSSAFHRVKYISEIIIGFLSTLARSIIGLFPNPFIATIQNSCFIPGILALFLPNSNTLFSLKPWLSISSLYFWLYSINLSPISSAFFLQLFPKRYNLSYFILMINRKSLKSIDFISSFLSPPLSITYIPLPLLYPFTVVIAFNICLFSLLNPRAS